MSDYNYLDIKGMEDYEEVTFSLTPEDPYIILKAKPKKGVLKSLEDFQNDISNMKLNVSTDYKQICQEMGYALAEEKMREEDGYCKCNVCPCCGKPKRLEPFNPIVTCNTNSS